MNRKAKRNKYRNALACKNVEINALRNEVHGYINEYTSALINFRKCSRKLEEQEEKTKEYKKKYFDQLKKEFLDGNKELITLSLAVPKDLILLNSPIPTEELEKERKRVLCYELAKSLYDNFDALRCVIQTVTGRPVDAKTDINFLKNKCVEQIEVDPIRFAKILTDKLLPYKVLLNKAVDAKIVTKRGTWHMYEGQAMSDGSEEPTFSVAAKFLSNPKNQEIKLSIEKKLQA